MSERLSLRWYNAQQAHQSMLELWAWAKPLLMAGHRLVVEIRPENRSLDQNSKFHAICADIAKSGMQWAGKERSAEQWKVLLVSGHAMATKLGSDMVPGLEGEFVNLRESTARMSVARASSLIEYTLAFCAAHQVPIRDARQWQVDPETGECMDFSTKGAEQ